MNLAAAVIDLRSGDVLAWRGTGFWAWIVRTWTRSPWAHIGIYWLDGNLPVVLEVTSPGGFNATAFFSHALPDAFIHAHLAWTHDLQVFAVKEYSRAPYSYLDAALAGIGLQPLSKDRGMMCSEYVVDVLAKAGWTLPWSPTPAHVLAEIQRATGNPLVPIERAA